MRKPVFPFLLALFALATWPMRAEATTITFEIVDPTYTLSENFPEGFQIDQQYGDRVTSTTMTNGIASFMYGVGPEGFTPNVQVAYGPSSIFTGGPSLWRYDYGDLDRVLFQGSTFTGVGNDYDYLELVFSADPGYEVLLYGLDLGGWFETDYVIDELAVYNDYYNGFFPNLNKVYSATDLTVSGAGPSRTSVNFASPLRGNVITLLVDARNLGSTSEKIGLDNIRFGQDDAAVTPVPEPSTLGVTLLGVAAVLGYRRRT
jgi:hypothetical protein